MEQKDEQLWQLAKKRASFKQNLYSYLIVNVLIWIVWWLTVGRHGRGRDWPWPLWVSLIWGIGVLLDYLHAYQGGDKKTLAEEEYEKLKRKQTIQN